MARDPFATVEWELRTAAIKGEGGEVLFEQHDCEIPATWSQLATNVVANKYFYGEVAHGGARKGRSPVDPPRLPHDRRLGHRGRLFCQPGRRRALLSRAVLALPAPIRRRSIRPSGSTWACTTSTASRGPCATGTGTPRPARRFSPQNPYEYPQASACFIQSVQDNMEDIMELARSEAMLFKFGSGTGTDLSTLRSHREKLSGGGKPSGPLSFMRVYDQIAAVVKSGGKTRRAAKMQSIKDWHPDVMEFIECKNREEKKVRTLVEQGYDPQEAYDTVLFQNANLSVRLSDDFMKAVEADQPWTTHWVTDPNQAGPSYSARTMLATMAQSAWCCGDPGVQYDTTINRWHTCPNSGRINASNPCSEYMFVDDSACNLASINLMKFRRDDGTFDAERFQAACRVVFVAQEILVDHASYPTKKIAANSHRFRPIGLGYSNLGSLIMTAGLPYDSEAARGLCGVITALLHGAACLTSTELAAAVGPFEAYEKNREPMLHVMEMHWEKVEEIKGCPQSLREAARDLWDKVLAHGKRHGFRNAQATVLAPTGTISFMMDCDTTGIEPDIALGQVQAVGRRRHVEDRQSDRAAGAADARLRRCPDRVDRGLHRQARHDRRRRRAEAGALAGVRLRLPAAERQAVDSLAGPHSHDGRGPAVHLRGDLEDGEHAQGEHARRRGRRLQGRLAAGSEGAGDLPRRVEGSPAAVDEDESRTRRRKRPSAPRAASGCPIPASRSPTSSASPATRATSPWASIPTAGPASCSSPWPRKAARSAA